MLCDMSIQKLQKHHLERMYAINKDSLPWVGKVSLIELETLLNWSDNAWGISVDGNLEGFTLCIPPKTSYASPNYTWFSQQFEDFLYVDRIAIDPEKRRSGMGRMIYAHLIRHAEARGVPMLAEVMKHPPNHASLAFHQRFGFSEVGELDHGTYTVSMLART